MGAKRRHRQTGRTSRKLLCTIACAFLLILSARAAAQVTSDATACRRDQGSLTRYLLCVELQTRRPPGTHQRYYAELDELETTVLRELPRGKAKQRRDILPLLYHAKREDTVYLRRLTLIDALDWRRSDQRLRLAADCDLFSLVNVGISERYYGAEHATRGVVLVRTRRDHVMTGTRRGDRLGGLLETETGLSYRSTQAVRTDHEQFELMSEREVIALYLAHVGLALAREGRDQKALEFLDTSLRFAPSEYVAHVGKALALLLTVATAADRTDDESRPWCAGGNGLALLDAAARSAESAIRLEPSADRAYSLLGKIALHQCRPERAQFHLERAVKMRPDPVDLYYLGLIHYEQDHLDRAIRLVRRGHKLARSTHDSRYRTLELEMEFLLAHAHTRRASLDASPRDLRKAMRFVESVRREFPEDEDIENLNQVIQRLDYRIGPVRRELGIPRGLSRGVYNASLDE